MTDSNEFDFFQHAENMDFGDVHFCVNSKTQLRAVIAIHDTRLGPALGGCRCVSYVSSQAAMIDAMRLAQGMSYKAAVSGLALGGGKAVLMKPPVIRDRQAYFESFGEFVDSLGGRYITAVDSGTGVEDMDHIARRTTHVACTSDQSGDPSPQTAWGVLRGIQAGVKFKLNRDNLDGVHVAIQGLGHVGYALAKYLHTHGARLSVCSLQQTDVQRVVDEFGATAVEKDAIFDVDCDVFSPCALGGILNENTVNRLRASIVAGAANNQLADDRTGRQLHGRGVLYAPDYVINAGGLIRVAITEQALMQQKVDGIYDTLLEIFQRCQNSSLTTNEAADGMAREIIEGTSRHSNVA